MPIHRASSSGTPDDERRLPMTTEQLQTEILRSVSRSFFLSLRPLPRRLREPISLAYLLARATDTVADTAEIPVATRRESLAGLNAAIEDGGAREALVRLKETFAPRQRNDAERTLIEALPVCLEWLDSLGGADRAEVRAVMAKIVRGQTLDLERFGGAGEVHALQTAGELDDYTYLVAGCVGEFWTRICARHLPGFSRIHEAEMLRLGVHYGQGLQLINILRDLGDDLRAGRCYLPADELAAVGGAPDRLADAPSVLNFWRQKAESGMAAGLEYAIAIRNRRVRIATALPALIGIRTLALLRDAGAESIAQRVKMPRAEVRNIVATTALTFGGRRTLSRMFTRLSH